MADTEKKAGNTVPWIVLSGFLGVFAVGAPAVNSTLAPKAAEKKDAPAAADLSGAIDDNPIRPLVEFHSTQVEVPTPESFLTGDPHGFDKEFLIATLPDPIDSPLGYCFDQVVDAVQRAVEKKDGYSLDRVWLPWELDRKNAASNAGKSAAAASVPLRFSQPGVLLFRRRANKAAGQERPGLLIAFLVGETPLGGLHKRALTHALQFMTLAKHPVDKPVRIVGPYFSGSQISLEFVLKDWWAGHQVAGLAPGLGKVPFVKLAPNPQYTFDVIAGSASAFRKADFQAIGPPGKANFSAAIIPTKPTLNALLYYLAKRDRAMAEEAIDAGDPVHLPGRVAILAESNTGLGSSVSNFGKSQVGLLLMRFPLHISRARAEMLQALKKKDEAAGLKATDAQIPSLGEDIVTGGNEGVPMQGGASTAAANSQVLANILTTVSKARCQYVGIVATDTRDKLFLVRLIREYCPDVHVFLTGGDLLLSHPEYRYALRGVIVGSTYPLLAVNQFWTNAASGERVLFASASAEGTYNAVLMHLNLKESLLEYRPPPFALATHDAAENERPPIWISMVAPSGNLVPLQIMTNYRDAAEYVRRYPGAELSELDRPMTLSYPGAMLPAGLILFAFGLSLFYRTWFVPSSPLACYALAKTGTLASMPQMLYRNLILGSLAIFSGAVVALIGTHGRTTHWGNGWDYPFFAVAVLLFLGNLAAIVFPFVALGYYSLVHRSAEVRKTWKSETPESLFWFALNAAVAGVFIGYACTFLNRYENYTDATSRILFFIRATDLSTGLSGLMPLFLLCLATGAWARYQLNRMTLSERYAIPTPFPVPDTNNEARWFDRAVRLDGLLKCEIAETHFLTRHVGPSIFIGIIVVSLATGLFLQSLPTVEGKVWDGLYFIGFAVVFALAASSLVHLYLIWGLLKRLLDAIAMIPMMRAFSRLPAKIVEVFGKYLYTQKPHLRHLQLAIQQLRTLCEAVKGDPSAPPELVALAERFPKLERVFIDHFARGQRPSDTELLARTIRNQMSEMAAVAMEALADRWTKLDVDDAFGGGPASGIEIKVVIGEPAWVGLAEGFAATQIVIYISQFFLQLRNMAWTVILSSSLLLLAATSYPFHPQTLLLYSLLGLIAAAMGMVLYVFAGMNRDTVVSRISRTTPGSFSLDNGMVGTVVTYVLPAAGVLTAQLSGSFRTVLEPLLRVLK